MNDRNSDTRYDYAYEDNQRVSRKERKKGTGRKKLWIGSCAVLTALVVGAISVISVSAGPDDQTQKAETLLTLSGDTAQDDAQGAGTGFFMTDVSDVVNEVLPSVVSVTSRSLVNYYGNSGYFGNGGDMGHMSELWDLFFGDSYGGPGQGYYYYQGPEGSYESNGAEGEDGEQAEEVETGMGSGTIIAQNSDELLILTSYHVVEDCSSLYVTFVNDANVDGYIKAADAEKDIAIVAIPLADIDQDTLSEIKIATISTEEPEVGDGCLVIGNALGYGTSVTSGIISKTDRQVYTENGLNIDVLQTDAAINFGNSGGCMVNAKGEIIGIAEAKTVDYSVEGMCYAIPVARNLDLIQDLMNAEEPFDPEAQENVNMNGGFLGIRGRDVTSDLSQEFEMPEGIYVSSVVQGSGAEEAGIQSGDIIVGFEGDDITTMAELQYLLGNKEAGDTIKLTINRLVDGAYESMDVEVTLTDRIS